MFKSYTATWISIAFSCRPNLIEQESEAPVRQKSAEYFAKVEILSILQHALQIIISKKDETSNYFETY